MSESEAREHHHHHHHHEPGGDEPTPQPTAPRTPAAVSTTITMPLDDNSWTDEWDTSINPRQATAYGHLSTGNSLLLQMYSEIGFGGWLCKGVCALPYKAATIIFDYTVIVDQATSKSAQVIETDAKIIDDSTPKTRCYDGSLQFNVANNWMVQIGAPWADTGIRIPPPTPGILMDVQIEYRLDYAAHTITFVSITVDGIKHAINTTYPAKEVGWTANTIVTQLQQCNRAAQGGYTLEFPAVGYKLQ